MLLLRFSLISVIWVWTVFVCVCGQVLPVLWGPNVHTMIVKLDFFDLVGTGQQFLQGK